MKVLFSSAIYENPLPQLRAVCSAFPGACVLEDGRILVLHQMGQAFESVDGTSVASFSEDGGKTWSEPVKLFDKSNEPVPITDLSKPTVLNDGSIMAFGYQFYRHDENLPIGNPETGGLLSDDIFYSVSRDGGNSWSERVTVPSCFKNSVEASAPVTVLSDGSLASVITGFSEWDGTPAARNCGRLIRSYDLGKTWDDSTVCTAFPNDEVTCYEQRMCQTQDGTIAVISWNENLRTGERMNNHVTFSFDNGKTFTDPVDTEIRGQASSILALDGSKVMTVHAMRRDTDMPGIYVAVADISGGRWQLISKELVWQPSVPVTKDTKMAEIFSFLKFGQPSAVRLADGSFLMTHWSCENGLYKTLATRFEL